jgi:hypothetical protein
MSNDVYKNGWIGLYRSILAHWIYPKNRPFTKYEAWIDLLLMVNFENKKVFIGENLIECDKGEIITSQLKLMNRWRWSKSKLLKFILVLENDKMCTIKSDNKKTSIKLCNYINHQDFKEISKNKKTALKTIDDTTKGLQKDTTKEYKEINTNTWRESFEVYLSECRIAYEIYMNNKELLKKQQRLNPGVNINLTIEKGFTNYWSTEDGWKNKKKSRSKEIDWNRTITNSINKINKVYYTKQELASL